ncbi:bZIP transcription factor 1 [Phytophthora citrophthora]|uniref:BZIP transcription factor 1 n=1 Tax=Phytophthora citrophthora TaxID=4793 RepID=A0AAD9H0T6_9STRA|nr:bZIP transcription factor 1 [Phytophthora citrophthora]
MSDSVPSEQRTIHGAAFQQTPGPDSVAKTASSRLHHLVPPFPHSFTISPTAGIYSNTSSHGEEMAQRIVLPPLIVQPQSIPGCKRSQHNAEGSVKARRNTFSPTGVEIESTQRGIEQRRERNRIHQARHKMKQLKRVNGLEVAIKHLRAEIQELTLQRRLIDHGVPTSTSLWGTAAEFFRLFQNSVRLPSATDCSRTQYDIQQNFLRATMAPDVTDGIVCGVDALLRTWTLLSQCYDKIDLHPVRLENGPDNALVATTKGTLIINENTLRNAFPHLVSDERFATLVDKMLGQQLELRGSVQFDWDSASARVTSIVCKADILTPLLRLLGSMQDVAYVFDNARLTPEGRLAPNESICVS